MQYFMTIYNGTARTCISYPAFPYYECIYPDTTRRFGYFNLIHNLEQITALIRTDDDVLFHYFHILCGRVRDKTKNLHMNIHINFINAQTIIFHA